jgi:hypothetical protein
MEEWVEVAHCFRIEAEGARRALKGTKEWFFLLQTI